MNTVNPHKYMMLFWLKQDVTPDQFRHGFVDHSLESFKTQSVSAIRLTVRDTAVEPAKKLLIESSKPLPSGVLSFRHPGAENDILSTIDALPLNKDVERYCLYLVTEKEPLVNHKHPPIHGERTYGMNQIVLFNKPAAMDYQQWLDTWHNSHTQIAIETQSTFGYRQNVIERAISSDALGIDAIVEENFPPEAMTSPHAFYNCPENNTLLAERQKIMFESVQRFIDLSRLTCMPMSEFNY